MLCFGLNIQEFQVCWSYYYFLNFVSAKGAQRTLNPKEEQAILHWDFSKQKQKLETKLFWDYNIWYVYSFV